MKKLLMISQENYNFPLDSKTLNKVRSMNPYLELYIYSQNDKNLFLLFDIYAKFLLVKRFKNFFLRHLLFLITGFIYLPIIIKKNKIKNILFQSPYDVILLLYLRILFRNKINIIIEFHGDMSNGIKYYNSNFIKELISNISVKLSLKFSDRIRAVSKNIKINTAKSKTIFPAFMELDYFIKPYKIKREKIILFVGFLHKIKNVAYLIDIFSKFQKENPDYKLRIIGNGPEQKNLEKLVKDNKIKNIEFIDTLNKERLKYEYYRSEMLILPSKYEGFGRVVVEAIACGCKVLVSQNCGVKDILSEKDLFEKVIIINKKSSNKRNILNLICNYHFKNGMKKLMN